MNRRMFLKKAAAFAAAVPFLALIPTEATASMISTETLAQQHLAGLVATPNFRWNFIPVELEWRITHGHLDSEFYDEELRVLMRAQGDAFIAWKTAWEEASPAYVRAHSSDDSDVWKNLQQHMRHVGETSVDYLEAVAALDAFKDLHIYSIIGAKFRLPTTGQQFGKALQISDGEFADVETEAKLILMEEMQALLYELEPRAYFVGSKE